MSNTQPVKADLLAKSNGGIEPSLGGAQERFKLIVQLVDDSWSNLRFAKTYCQIGLPALGAGLAAEEQANALTRDRYIIKIVPYNGHKVKQTPWVSASELANKPYDMQLTGGPTLIQDAIAFARQCIEQHKTKLQTQGKLVAESIIIASGDMQRSDGDGRIGHTVKRNGEVIEVIRLGLDKEFADECAKSCADPHGINYFSIPFGKDINWESALQLAGGREENMATVDIEDEKSVSAVIGDIVLCATQLSSNPTSTPIGTPFGFEGRFSGTSSRDFTLVS